VKLLSYRADGIGIFAEAWIAVAGNTLAGEDQTLIQV